MDKNKTDELHHIKPNWGRSHLVMVHANSPTNASDKELTVVFVCNPVEYGVATRCDEEENLWHHVPVEEEHEDCS